MIDHWWQTETGWPIVANPAGIELLPIKPGSPTRPLPGWDVRVLDPFGKPVPAGTDGAIVVKLPMPPGSLPTLWNDDERYVNSYLSVYDGYYLTGDGGRLDERRLRLRDGPDRRRDQCGRTPVVHREHGGGAGRPSGCGGMRGDRCRRPAQGSGAARPGGAQGRRDRDPVEIEAELVALIRAQIGAVAGLKDVAVVPALPKTRSGKILRKTMRGIADGLDEPVPSTIEDASVLDALRPILRRSS